MSIPNPENEETLYQAVLSGWIEVRHDGSIWRIAQRKKSKTGTVSVKTTAPHRIDGRNKKDGYRKVKMMVDGKQTSCAAHRLVWRVVRGQIPNGLTVNHEDGDKANNDPENLTLATYSEQTLHAYRTGLMDEHGERNPAAKLTNAQVEEIRERYSTGTETQEAIGAAFGVAFQTVSKIVRGERRQRQAGATKDYIGRRARGNKNRGLNGRFSSSK